MAVLSRLLLEPTQAGKFTLISKGQLSLSSLELRKNGGVLLPELLTFQEKLATMGFVELM